MAILDLQDMEMTEEVAYGSSRSKHSCGGGGGGASRLSLLLC
jgi:Lanthionine-containing peptide SapB precursor RamS